MEIPAHGLGADARDLVEKIAKRLKFTHLGNTIDGFSPQSSAQPRDAVGFD